VNGPGDEFFSCSGLPQNENGRIGWRNDLNALQNGLESESLSHHVPVIVIEADLVFQIKFFGGEPLLISVSSRYESEFSTAIAI
jgi:hypothetical protein